MLKHFQKLRLFFWKDEDNDTNAKSDKIKYLHRRELDISKNWKIKNDNCDRGKFPKQHSVETRKKSKELVVKKPRQRQLMIKATDEDETYFVSPKELKKYRKYLEKSGEKSPKRLQENKRKYNHVSFDNARLSEERRTRKRKEDAVRQDKHFEKNVHQHLTKKDIFRIINTLDYVPRNVISASFLKKILDYDKHEKITKPNNNHKQKSYCYNDDINVIFMSSTSADSTGPIKSHKKENGERTSILRKINKIYEKDNEFVDKNIKNQKSYGTGVNGLDCEEFKYLYNKKTGLHKFLDSQISKVKPNLTPKALITKEIIKEDSNRKLKHFLVKNTFSLVDITPTYNKKSTVGKSSFTIINNKYETYSDRHKTYQYSDEGIFKKKKQNHFGQKRNLVIENHVSAMYVSPKVSRLSTDDTKQKDISEQKRYLRMENYVSAISVSPKISGFSTDDTKKFRDVSQQKDSSERKQNLRMESCVSVITIKPKISRIWSEAASQCDRYAEEKNRLDENALFKSKIPWLHDNVKATKLPSEFSPVLKRRQSSTLFIPKTLKGKNEEETDAKNATLRNKSWQGSEKKSTKFGSKKTITYLGPVTTTLNAAEKKTFQTKESKIVQRRSKLPRRTVTLISKQKSIEVPKSSRDGTSSMTSESSKVSVKTITYKRKSDTKLQVKGSISSEKKYKSCDRSAEKSISNSTHSNRSQKETKLFLTKSYKDDDKLKRLQKQKMYSEKLRKSRIIKNKQVLLVPLERKDRNKKEMSGIKEVPNGVKEFYDNDLPQPCMELVKCDKFESHADETLNMILNENFEFLNKDFSFKINDLEESESSEENFSVTNIEEETNTWYDFEIADNGSFTEISPQKPNKINVKDLNLDKKDLILDSLSPPGSEESGYTSMSSRRDLRNLFEQSDVKTLLETPLSSYFVEIHLESRERSNGLELRSIQSKSLQASVVCSEKSIQNKLSTEQIMERNNKEDVLRSGAVPAEISFKNSSDCYNIQLSAEIAHTLEEIMLTTCDQNEHSHSVYNNITTSKNETKTKLQNFSKKFKIKFLSCISCGSSSE